MDTTTWRTFLLTLCAVALASTLYGTWVTVNADAVGVSMAAPAGPSYDRIKVDPGSAASRAGLRTGDVIDIARLSHAARYRLFSGQILRGENLTIWVVRGGRERTVTLVGGQQPITWDIWLALGGIFWMVLFAALISWRRADSPEARTLALMLVFINLSVTFTHRNWTTPWPAVDALIAELANFLWPVGFALFATYAMLFGRPATLLRRVLAWLSYLGAGLAAARGLTIIAVTWFGTADPARTPVLGPYSGQLFSLSMFLPLICALVTLAQTRGSERARLAWTTASFGLLYAAILARTLVYQFHPSWSPAAQACLNTSAFIAPLGLTYSLLNRRLLDIGFAINRAAVFSVVSILLVGTFVLVEWALSEWFRNASHATNILISAALALLLGLSIRAVHSRVDFILDSVFFRKRHQDEQAIRTLAQEAAYITDTNTLLQRATQTLEQHADASFADFLLDDGAGRYSGIPENDPAFVALRTWRKVLDLHTVQTELRGEFAYPMLARGRLIGALVLGPKRSGESYAPDESEAIAQLAQDVGNALEVLALKTGESHESILNAIQKLSESLPDAIANRLDTRMAQ